MRGPVGPLYMRKDSDEYAFLATGIGITPFRALLKKWPQPAKNKVTLFFAGNKDNHFFRDELSELNAKMPNLKIKIHLLPPNAPDWRARRRVTWRKFAFHNVFIFRLS